MLIACVLGMALGLALSSVTVSVFAETLRFSVDFVRPWVLFVPALVLAVVVGLAASVVPARRAARLDPVAALRFD